MDPMRRIVPYGIILELFLLRLLYFDFSMCRFSKHPVENVAKSPSPGIKPRLPIPAERKISFDGEYDEEGPFFASKGEREKWEKAVARDEKKDGARLIEHL